MQIAQRKARSMINYVREVREREQMRRGKKSLTLN